MKIKKLIFVLILFSFGMNAQQDEEFDIILVDIPPIASECNPDMSNAELRNCLQRTITKKIVSNINFSIIENERLPSGEYRILAFFSINKKGKIKIKKTNFDNKAINSEIKRVLRLIEKMKPAYLNEKPVTVKYSIPIRFNIE